MRRSAWTTLVMFSLVVGCVGARAEPRPPLVNAFVRWVPKLGEYGRPDTPDADFRSGPPASAPLPPIVPPKVEEKRLVNGMRVLWVERHDLPIVSLRFVSSVGTPQGDPGLTDFLAHACLHGVKSKAGKDVAITLEGMGVASEQGAGYDGSMLGFRMLGYQLRPVLELASSALRRTSYSATELEWLRGKWMLALARRIDDREGLADDVARWLVFPKGHPYGHPALGNTADVGRITKADLEEHHALVFDPKRMSVVAAGDIDRTVLIGALEESLTDWKGAGREPVTSPEVSSLGRRVVIVDRPGDTQARVRIVGLTPSRGAPGSLARSLLSTILARRMFATLREKHGWTYSTEAVISSHRLAGYVSVGGAIEVDHVGEALTEILAELTRLGSETVPDDELSLAKQTAAARHAAAFETVSAITDALSMLALFERPVDDWTKAPERMAAVSAEDVMGEAKRYLAPASMSIVAVGDATKLRPQLEALSLGKIEVHAASP